MATVKGTAKADSFTVNASNVMLNVDTGNDTIEDYRIVLLHILTIPK